MFLKKNLFNDRVFLILILFFAIFFNHFSGNRGIFPADSFAFFDSGQRILNGEFPFKDYWVVSGPFIDYFQALLFFIHSKSYIPIIIIYVINNTTIYRLYTKLYIY